MRRKGISLFSTVVITSAILFHSTTVMAANHSTIHSPTIEVREEKEIINVPHPRFSWDNPGPTSPVLHPGSIKGAGMVEGPLHAIDRTLDTLIEEGMMPGAVTFVARRGHIVQHESYGHALLYRDDAGNYVDNPIEMKKDTIFDLASISKIFTTTAAMILYEDGHFELDDPVVDYIPEFAENGKENVTIRQLMTHTSGFTAWVPLYTIGENKEERLQYVFQYPLENEPGTTYTYSDLNMITLGALIERLSGQGLDDYVYQNITKPLKMTDTMYNPPSSLKHRIAATEYQPWTDRGLVWGEVHDENAWSLGGVAGHAGVFATAHDLGKLAHMFINEGRYGGTRILQPETIQLLVENQIPEFLGNDHGLGWELSQGWYMDALSESSTLGHTGYTGTSIVVNLNNDTIAILLTNRVHPTRETASTNPARRTLSRHVADAIPVKLPDKRGKTWFAGYGDGLNRSFTLEIDIEQDATLHFNTWYRTEQGYDFGFAEISDDGETWSPLRTYSGSSVDFIRETLEIPARTTHIRFRYQTDATTNGRGWYVSNLQLTDPTQRELPINITENEWEKRNY